MSGVDFAAVRAAISMEQVLKFIGFIPAERRGPQWRGPCPIHDSQSPSSRSFSVNVTKGAFRCFQCGAQGN
jgi:DNA primase